MRVVRLWLALTLALMGTVACGGGGGDSTAVGTTVIGTVTNGRGMPVPVLPVVVEGHAPVLTDASGQFRVEGVSVPYTVILIKELGQHAQVITGLTRLDPSFSVGADINYRSAALSGTTSGGVGFPLPPDYHTVLAYSTVASGTAGYDGANPATGDWNVPDLEWQGPLSTTAQFFVLQVHVDGAGLVDDFTGLATLEAPIGNGETRSGFEFALGNVDTAFCSGTVNAPPGYTYVAKVVLPMHASGNTIQLPPDSGPLDTFSLATVDAPDVSTALLVSLAAPGGGNVVVVLTDIPVPVSGLSVDVPSETVLVSPINGATGVWHDTPFTASPDAGRLYTFVWDPQGDGPEIELITNEPFGTIPDLAAYGLAIPPGAIYEWVCQVQGPDVTVDDFATDRRTGPLSFESGFVQFTSGRTFTTGP